MPNPLLRPWDTAFGLPPFPAIGADHFAPAFAAAMAENRDEIAAIAADPAPPDFANTIEALERTGRTLDRISRVFSHLCAACTDDALQGVEREMAPKLAAHRNAIRTDQGLFARIDAVAATGGAGLTPEQRRVLDRYHRMFVKAGARLTGAGRARMAAIEQRLAALGTAFAQNVLADETDWVMFLGADELAGLPDFLVAAAAREAADRGRPGAYAITLGRSSVEPFLAFSARRDLREAVWRAWASRGEATNWPVIDETLRLRAERARLVGFRSYAAMRLDDQMAKTPEAVKNLLLAVWAPARRRAGEEAAALAALAAEEGANIRIAPWDWRYYAEKLRKRVHDLDEAETKPFLALDSVIAAAFDVAGRLFGLRFRGIEGLALPHPEARAWEVTGRDGRHLGLFVGDYFARPGKRSGAWMSALRGQQKLWEPARPIVLNTLTVAPGGAGQPALLTWDDARTVFHEFGHALHGLMSDVTYPSLWGTSVARDFVELPSQLYEHWLMVPEVLARHARHYRTGAPMPEAMIRRLRAAETFNQGFAMTEFLASALVDLELHVQEDAADIGARAVQGRVLAEINMPAEIAMRHASPHFQHVFSGDGYAAGYYSYLWSETMDADAFRAFEEAGDPFDPATAARLGQFVYSAGGRQDEAEAYIAFRGRMPGVEAVLAKRGLAAPES